MSKIRSNFHVVIVVGAVTLILGLALGAACTADDPGPAGSQVSSGVVFLNQNWTEADRQFYYTTGQGSAMMPYRIFLHLEQASSDELFRVDANMERMGIIPNPANATYNPDGLPIGLSLTDIEEGRYQGQWVGPTCAFCHTSQFEYKGTKIRIDGGSALFEWAVFLVELTEAIEATSQQPAKYDRLARNVLGEGYDQDAENILRQELEVSRQEMRDYLELNLPPVEYGPGRTAALAGIFNMVTVTRLGIPENRIVTRGYENPPFLWNAGKQTRVHWNGSSSNPMERNVGQVLGVFGRYDLTSPTREKGLFESTVDFTSLFQLEQKLLELKPPAWPENVLGEIDLAKAKEGEPLFQKNCSTCHQTEPYRMAPANVFGIPLIDITMTPLDFIGTDRALADELNKTMVKPGNLADYMSEECKALPGPKFPIGCVNGAATSNVLLLGIDELGLSGAETREFFGNRPRSFDPDFPAAVSTEAYKAGLEEGIWATVPFLHNGSVPSMYQLLLPAEERVKKFCVNREYDPVNMGIDITATEGCFVFDTALPGNSNAGHENKDGPLGNGVIGPLLTDDERWALIEYLKTLP